MKALSILIALMASLAGFSSTGAQLTPVSGQESALKFRYQVSCDETSSPILHEMNASVVLPDRQIRFNLFEARSHGELVLGPTPARGSFQIRLDQSDHCHLKSFHARIAPLEPTEKDTDARLALRHAPYLGVRQDQLRNKGTDLPLLLAYSVTRDGPVRTLRYTIYFTDEDTQSSKADTNAQMSKYGRRTDIEWLYEVTLDQNDRVLSRRYQGDWMRGWGHTIRTFHGRFIPGTEHPILYDIASHNVFSDRPRGKQAGGTLVGYHLVPRERIGDSEPREWVMFRHPWIFQLSDQELAFEHKLGRPATEYLYVARPSPDRPDSIKNLHLLSAPEARAAELHPHDVGFSAIPMSKGELPQHGWGARELRIMSSNGHYHTREVSERVIPR